jgi:TonB family protein
MLRPLPPVAGPRVPSQRTPQVTLPPAVAPAPAPTPEPRQKDTASIGTHAEDRSRLALERDRDIGSLAGRKGLPGPTSTPSPPGADRTTAGPDKQTAQDLPRTASGPLPAGPGTGAVVDGEGTLPQARRGGGGAPGSTSSAGQRSASGGLDQQRSITRSLEELDKRLGQMGGGGMAGAAGVQVGSMFYDPEGADFTAWINHFKNEVYRNWVPPQAVMFGFAGHVDFEFWVERDGRVTDLKMLKSTGTPSLDRAAQNALTSSRLLPLPADYRPARFRMQIGFYYNQAPQS